MDKVRKTDQLTFANNEIAFLNQEKEKRASELRSAYKEIAFQIEERGSRAAELAIANIELTFQNDEKEKRAAELVIANNELFFQNQEKEKRAAELAIANIELIFQNEEKEKRATELIIANKELVFQNQEKEKRAAELIIANRELVFQNKEKEKRAREFAVVNSELQKAEAFACKLNEELEQKVISRSAQYAFISQVNQTIVHVKDAETLFREACHIAIKFGKFKMAWIGSLDIAKKKITLLDYCGISSDDIKQLTDATHAGNGMHDIVFGTGKYFLCNNIEETLELENWKSYAAKHSIRSCIVLPIMKSGNIFGTFNLYSAETDFFDQANVKMAVEVTGHISFALDLFEEAEKHKETEENLGQSEAKLREAQALSHISSWEVDLATNIIKRSDEFFNIYGISREEIATSSEAFLLMLHPEDYEFTKASVEKLYQTFEPGSFSTRIKKRDGSTRHIYTEWKFEFNKSRKPIRLYGILQDVTDRKIAEEEREKLINDTIQRNRDLEQFTFIISHNLRGYVTNVMGIAEILQDETLTAKEEKEFLQALSISVSGLDTVIKDINSILQVKREVIEKKELIFFSQLVNDILVSIGNLIEKDHVRLKLDFVEVNEFFSLKVYLHSIFYNLISNSIKYCKADEQLIIEIKSKKENGKVILTFKDNGLGIDMKTKGDKVFGLYKRFHSHIEGKGMGLFMVKTQVEAMGGKITITSELNKGTEFTIVFD